MSQASSSGSRCPPAPLKATSKVGARSGYPLVLCPNCGDEVIELVSGTPRNPGKIFFKCCQNEEHVPGTCRFFKFADKYLLMLQTRGVVGPVANYRHDVYAVASSMNKLQGQSPELQVTALNTVGYDVDAKMSKMINIGQLVVLSNVVVCVLVLLAVLLLLVK